MVLMMLMVTMVHLDLMLQKFFLAMLQKEVGEMLKVKMDCLPFPSLEDLSFSPFVAFSNSKRTYRIFIHGNAQHNYNDTKEMMIITQNIHLILITYYKTRLEQLLFPSQDYLQHTIFLQMLVLNFVQKLFP